MAQISQVSPNQPALPATAALLIFDPQEAFDDPERGRRHGTQAEADAARLLAAWRAGGGPVIHVQQLSRQPSRGFKEDEVRPRAGEFVIQKSTHDAFIDTGLAPFLAERGIDTLVIAGVITSNSVEATLRGAGNLGYRTFLADDATITPSAAVLEAR